MIKNLPKPYVNSSVDKPTGQIRVAKQNLVPGQPLYMAEIWKNKSYEYSNRFVCDLEPWEVGQLMGGN